MEKLTLLTSEEHASTRLDAFLADQLEATTRSGAVKLIESGQVTVNGKAVAKNYKLRGGETVEVEVPDPAPIALVPQDIPLDIVYEDGDVIVVNKPKGLVVHPAPGHPDGTLVNALLYHCGDSLSGIGGELRPGIVHRIDRDTSGLIIAAKNDLAHQGLSDQLQDHTLSRVYRCIVTGNLREDCGTVDAPIGRHPIDRKKMAVVHDGRRAVTHWQVLERYQGFTYVECRLETGRTHQIRVHMAHTGHPILGDTVYGSKKAVPGLQGQCLHAVGLRFLHPRTGEAVELHCGLTEEFEVQLKKLRAKSGC
ncbi:MAG: RluA family pseudouridine synthase [Oscillibacter sp.]|nr:RluA family pseudouridine synthase [Oscillibacter sp.]MBQ2996306.1 RluA family pseudouridine synthase [Oscillibacter sp.]